LAEDQITDTPFYRTRMGHKFYERTLPELVKQIAPGGCNRTADRTTGSAGREGIVMPYLCPPTLTADEQKLILQVTAKHPRDHLIISMALGTGLRLCELVGLNVGDVFAPNGTPKTRVRVRHEIAKRGRVGDVFVPDRLAPKLRRFWRFKKKRGEGLEPSDPLFCSQSRRRISPRRVQFAWREWQKRAGFDRLYGFHALRHSSVTNVYRATRDLFLAQRFARHASPLTTTVYTHPSDEEMQYQLRRLSC
jgi:integrase